jgi:hypothetical protein
MSAQSFTYGSKEWAMAVWSTQYVFSKTNQDQTAVLNAAESSLIELLTMRIRTNESRPPRGDVTRHESSDSESDISTAKLLYPCGQVLNDGVAAAPHECCFCAETDPSACCHCGLDEYT